MINSNRSSNKKLYRLIVGLPFMIIACFTVLTSHARTPNKTMFFPTQQLKDITNQIKIKISICRLW